RPDAFHPQRPDSLALALRWTRQADPAATLGRAPAAARRRARSRLHDRDLSQRESCSRRDNDRAHLRDAEVGSVRAGSLLARRRLAPRARALGPADDRPPTTGEAQAEEDEPRHDQGDDADPHSLDPPPEVEGEER